MKKQKQTDSTHIAFLLDRSGSMESCKTEVISGFNAYVDKLREDKRFKTLFTLTQFDSQGVDVVYNGASLASLPRMTAQSFQPRGSTPLYDAIGKTIIATEQACKKSKVLFVTLTDGQENASSEWRLDTVQNLMKEKEKQGWTFAHIGVGIGWRQAAQTIAHGTMSASNVVRATGANSKQAFAATAAATLKFRASKEPICCDVDFYHGQEKDFTK